MPLSPGSRLGPYEITAPLGAGGMGEVWRARDTKLNRSVAIKSLPAGFDQDSGRMARFQREAELLAALNHPNIAAIYGIEQGAIVMELVEGEDLKGPLPVDTALHFARQIAVALEAAHEKGIIHRDLKPANIKVTPDGTIKLLDFGLAKAADESVSGMSSQSPTMSPTLTVGMTQAGVILGTAAYMSPEQARGKPVDRRADIWAFGVVFYEMLCGTPLFGGETVTDTLASVVKEAPDWKALPADTPPRIRRLLERCLQKDPKLRLQAIGEARIAIDESEPEAAPSPAAAPPQRKALVMGMAGITVLALLAAGAAWLRPRAADSSIGPVRMQLALPEGMLEAGSSATPQAVASPNGRFIAFVANDPKVGHSSLWVRTMDSLTAHRLDKTVRANYPFWSPDSRFIAFFAGDKLMSISVDGGTLRTICSLPGIVPDAPTAGDGGTWNREGVILLSARNGQALLRVPAAGGVPTAATELDKSSAEITQSWPQFLPDGKHFLYFSGTADTANRGIYVRELGSPQRTLVTRNATRAAWAPPGYLLLVRGGTLLAQRMNDRTFQLEGEPVTVVSDVTDNVANGRSAFAVSPSGTLVYRAGATSTGGGQLAWFDRDGKPQGPLGKIDQYFGLVLSPDERSVEVSVGGATNPIETWVVNAVTGVPTRLPGDGVDSRTPGPWSPDSQRLAINSSSGIRIVDVASGKGTPLITDLQAEAWLPDGSALLCNDKSLRRLSLLSLSPGSKPQNILDTQYAKSQFQFSPDGKWVAYTSTEPGYREVFVASFPSFAVKKQVSLGGGNFPAWRSDGKAVYYRSVDAWMAMAEVRTGSQLELGSPKKLFPYGTSVRGGNRFGLTKDGRFLFLQRDGAGDKSEVVILLNWLAELTSHGGTAIE